MRIRPYYSFLSAALSVFLISCGGTNRSAIFSSQDGPPTRQVDVSQIPDAVPKHTKLSRYGNPRSYEVFGKRYTVMPSSQGYKERGVASWYGSKFHGNRTSSGETYDMHGMTAAHKTLPLPTFVRVTNLRNDRQVILKVNDRGPFHDNRLIDLSHTAAVKLGIKGSGTGLVEVEAIDTRLTTAAANPSAANSPAKTAVRSHLPPVKPNKPAASSVALFLQLGAFLNSQNASNLQNRINSAMQSKRAYIATTQKNNQQFFRVRIGPLQGVKQADALAQVLFEKGFGQPRILIE